MSFHVLFGISNKNRRTLNEKQFLFWQILKHWFINQFQEYQSLFQRVRRELAKKRVDWKSAKPILVRKMCGTVFVWNPYVKGIFKCKKIIMNKSNNNNNSEIIIIIIISGIQWLWKSKTKVNISPYRVEPVSRPWQERIGLESLASRLYGRCGVGGTGQVFG